VGPDGYYQQVLDVGGHLVTVSYFLAQNSPAALSWLDRLVILTQIADPGNVLPRLIRSPPLAQATS
jgi:hypothetical protein